MTGLELMQELRIEVGPGDDIESYMENSLAKIIDIIQAGNCAAPFEQWLKELKEDACIDCKSQYDKSDTKLQ